MTACGAIGKTQLGERVLIDGRVYVVCGFSPMSVQPPRLLLEDAGRKPADGVARVRSLE